MYNGKTCQFQDIHPLPHKATQGLNLKDKQSDDAPPALSNTTQVDEAAFTSTWLGCGKATMEELQKVLVTKIGEQLKAKEMNIQLLDSLNRLLGTVSSIIHSTKVLASSK